uniref:Uncharacterized protein n=1 Tax=Lactuca sativa TaxID=4236 RepID=A0A9R1WLY7_LACSA|nr:hypothetical protein LSAT_V11C100008850 [Lactuca sativa]
MTRSFRCGDYFSLDSLELRDTGFEILIKEGEKILLRAHDGASVTSILLPCTSCSLKIRLVINKDTRPYICGFETIFPTIGSGASSLRDALFLEVHNMPCGYSFV